MTVRQFTFGSIISVATTGFTTPLNGAWSACAVVKRTNEGDYVNLLGFASGGSHRGGLWLTDTGLIQAVGSGFSAQAPLDVPLNSWVYVGVDKPPGDEVTVRGHLQILGSGPMSHANSSNTVNDDGNTPDAVTIGNNANDFPLHGLCAGVGFLTGDTWSDADHEANAAGLQAWIDNGATNVWPLTQTGDPPAQVVDAVADSDQINQGADGTAAVDGDDPPGFSLSLGGGTDHTATPADNIGLTDAATTARAVARTATDTAGLADTAATAVARHRTHTDSAGLTDAVTTAVARARTITDNAGLTDTGAPLAIDYGEARTDTAGLTDTVTLARQVTITDSIGASDAAAAQVAGGDSATVADSAGLTDTVVVAVTRARPVTDSAGLADLVTAAQLAARTVIDSAGLTDATTTAHTVVRPLADGMGLTDSVVAQLGGTGPAAARGRVRLLSTTGGVRLR